MTDTSPRPQRPTLAELRAVAQPPEVRNRKNAEHWSAQLYLRHISIYITVLLVRTRISANGVTGLMILSGWAIAASLLIPGIWGPVLAVVFSQLQMLIDCCDGEVARWRNTMGAKGIFLDKVGHYTTESFVAIAIGLRAIGDLNRFGTEPGIAFKYAFAGALLAVFVLLNKALNDMVHVSRAFTKLDKLPDSKEAMAVNSGMVGTLRNAAKFVPFHRIYHSVELALLSLAAALFTLFFGGMFDTELVGERGLVMILVPLSILATAGHFVAIMASKRLR
ncbi:CDP-alcohol phosphatidyltransferase family protein [Saxibacter everestensis]|uniref:CDP-alcohol phosphatidyltransferase family protein n=1 Tax=Saxibacter everestensis TaxID=2909229 RepID=A0ABY8QVB8_9MICO|nr:CDP-alcohol phosphatidyltransferase family protein [Brevibacteriaceae bacterium ZFBP1038]